MKLLIADDEIIIRQGLMQIAWDSIGITEVKVAENGLEALKLISTFEPNIILTDIRMPGMDGLELSKIIFEQNIPCKIIYLTGYAIFEYAKEAIGYGVYEYLLKPTSPLVVLNCVKGAIELLTKCELTEQLEETNKKVFRNSEDKSTVGVILKYIEENYMKDISLTTLSEVTHFSTVHLCRLIKKETNYSFLKLVCMMRMLKASELLGKTDMKIYSICEKIGIADQRYFSQQFKKIFGKTPMEYRRTYNSNLNTDFINFISSNVVLEEDIS